MSWQTLNQRLDRLARSVPMPPSDLDAAARGQAALATIGVDLSRLPADALERLEALVAGWPGDEPIPLAVIATCVGNLP